MISLLLHLSLLLFSPLSIEQCGNGLDDDGDGLIDLNDPDCNCAPFATTIGPELIFNGGFELISDAADCQGCISLYDSDGCPLGWLQESVNLHTSCFTSQNPAQNLGYISSQTENYQGVGGYGSNSGNTDRVQQEYLQTELLAPSTSGQTYRFSADLEMPTSTLQGINIVSNHQLVILGSELAIPGDLNADNCYEESSGWIKLASLEMRNIPQDVFNNYSTSFIAPGPIRHLAIASACCQSDSLTNDEELTYWAIDNLRLNLAEAEPLEVTINTQAPNCDQSVVLCVSPPQGSQLQWYRAGVALIGQNQPCLSLANNTLNGTVFQCLITTNNNCGLATTGIQRNCDFAPEVCNNGLDDDGDGLTDLNDPDCICTNLAPLINVDENYCPTDISLSTILSAGQSAQWYYNGVAIAGAVNEFLQLGLEADLLGLYALVVTNDSTCGRSTPFQAEFPDGFNFVWDFEVARCYLDSTASIFIHLANSDTADYLFSWENEAGVIIGTAATLENIPAGNYRLSLSTPDNCSGQFSFSVPGPAPPRVFLSLSSELCKTAPPGATLTLTTENFALPVEHSYFEVPNLIPIAGNNILLENGDYSGRTTDANGCSLDWGPIVINSPAVPVFQISALQSQLALGETTRFQLITNADNLENLQWSPAEITDCPNCLATNVTPLRNTLISVSALHPTTGCLLSDSSLLVVNAESNVYHPTAFSPNHDGINDVWKIFGGPAVSTIGNIKIFDRWGGIVYSNPHNIGWDGKREKGKDAPSGMYVFKAEIIFIDGQEKLISGGISLIRD